MWRYRTANGTFFIKQLPDRHYGLYLDAEYLGRYLNPHQAADEVYTCTTGNYEWDSQGVVLEPADLGEWERIPTQGR